jgi:hypothetical protein
MNPDPAVHSYADPDLGVALIPSQRRPNINFDTAQNNTVLINSEATFVRTMGSRRMEVDLAWSVKRSGSGFRIYNILVVRIQKTTKLLSITLKRSSTASIAEIH